MFEFPKDFNWSGGSIHSAGYIVVYMIKHPFTGSQGRCYEHRLIMEKHLKRYLLPHERVHHINGVKDDNRIKNLRLFLNHSEHIKSEIQNINHGGIKTRFKKGQPAPSHKPYCKCFRCTKIPIHTFKKGEPPVPHKQGCKCFRCDKNSPHRYNLLKI